MKTLPYKIDVFAAAETFILIGNPELQLNFIINMLHYKESGIITASALRKLGTMVLIDEAEVLKRMQKQKNLEDLVKYCAQINTLYQHNFFTLNFLRFLNIEANAYCRFLTTSGNVFSHLNNNNLHSLQKSN